MFCLRKTVESVNMLKNIVARNALPQHKNQSLFRLFSNTIDINTSAEQQTQTKSTSIKGGFAKAFEKQSQLAETQDTEQSYTFASLLRNSKLIDVSYK